MRRATDNLVKLQQVQSAGLSIADCTAPSRVLMEVEQLAPSTTFCCCPLVGVRYPYADSGHTFAVVALVEEQPERDAGLP